MREIFGFPRRARHAVPFAFRILGTALLCAGLAMGLPACKKTRPEDRVLLDVNGDVLKVGEFETVFARLLPTVGEPPEGSTRWHQEQIALLQRLIDRMLIAQEAGRLGVVVSDDEVKSEVEKLTAGYDAERLEKMLIDRNLDRAQWEAQIREKLIADRVVQKALASQIQISDEECAAYYEQHVTDYARPKEVHARQILVDSRAKAEELRTQIRRGADFGEVARENSQSPDAKDGGDLGYFSAGHMPPEFDRVVFKLPVHKVSDVVPSPYGFHLFWVEEIKSPRTLTLDDVREEIRGRLAHEQMEGAYGEWLASLRKGARIEIHEELLSR